MEMRTLIDIMAEASPSRTARTRAFGDRWWINTVDGTVDAVRPDSNSHEGMVLANPRMFGVTDEDRKVITDRWAGDPFAMDRIMDDIIFLAMSRGWVRAGTGEYDGLDAPFAYGVSFRHVQLAAKWMADHGFVTDALNIEIMDEKNPSLSSGDFYQLRNASLDRFLRTGRL